MKGSIYELLFSEKIMSDAIYAAQTIKYELSKSYNYIFFLSLEIFLIENLIGIFFSVFSYCFAINDFFTYLMGIFLSKNLNNPLETYKKFKYCENNSFFFR